jgi:hypothetical protein
MRRPTPQTRTTLRVCKHDRGSKTPRKDDRPTRDGSKDQPHMTAGLDIGDNYSYPLCLIDSESGEIMEEGRLRTTPETFRRRF